MDGCLDKWVSEWIWMNRWVVGWMGGWYVISGRLIDEWMDIYVNLWMMDELRDHS